MTSDLQIIRGFNQPSHSTIAYATPGRALQGTAKVAQKFGLLFLREYDSIADRGTLFVTNMRNGRMRTDAAVVTNFTAAVLKIMRQLGDQSALPATEQLVRADLLAHSVFSDQVELTVQITTKDGLTEFILPISKLQ